MKMGRQMPPLFFNDIWKSLPRKYRQVDGFSHGFVARVVRMEMVAVVESRLDLFVIRRIANDRIEIDYCIKCATRPYPVVERNSSCVAQIRVVGGALEGVQRTADDFDSMSMGSF